jgi:hypothetical protein
MNAADSCAITVPVTALALSLKLPLIERAIHSDATQ